MVKGGSRIPSDKMAVGKGMGLYQHYKTLQIIKEMDGINIRLLMSNLNKKFAWWDDPQQKAPTETCRSYTKELWRLGLIDRIDRDSMCIKLNSENWRKRSSTTMRLSERGKFIMNQKQRQFPYFIAHCIVDAMNSGVYPQCKKLFELYDKIKYIPINDDKTASKTKRHGIYVEKHAGKAIKFGWLEPTGLIYRKNSTEFHINKQFKKYLERICLHDIFSNITTHIDDDAASVILLNPILDDTYFKMGTELKFSFEFKNKTTINMPVMIKPRLSSVFEHTTNLNVSQKRFIIAPKSNHIINFTLTSKSFGYSDSFWVIFCGLLDITINKIKKTLYFPTVIIRKEEKAWEIELLKEFAKLGLKTFHFGRSDRPDGVIDLSGLTSEPEDLLGYLRDDKKEKMLMETANGVYSWAKLDLDTNDTPQRESKFKRHTTRVLKIKAIGQIIAASEFQKNITSMHKHNKHIVTLIDLDTLQYIFDKKKESGNGQDVILKLLKLNKIITKPIVSSAFEE